MTSKFTRKMVIHPGFDKRDPDPKKNYGISGCRLIFAVHDNKGHAVTTAFFTDWFPDHVQKQTGYHQTLQRPMPAGWDYHEAGPVPEGKLSNECWALDGAHCVHTDGSFISDDFYEALLDGGSEKVFELLEIRLTLRFDDDQAED